MIDPQCFGGVCAVVCKIWPPVPLTCVRLTCVGVVCVSLVCVTLVPWYIFYKYYTFVEPTFVLFFYRVMILVWYASVSLTCVKVLYVYSPLLYIFFVGTTVRHIYIPLGSRCCLM